MTFKDFLPVVIVNHDGIEYSHGSDLIDVTGLPSKYIKTESGSLFLSASSKNNLYRIIEFESGILIRRNHFYQLNS